MPDLSSSERQEPSTRLVLVADDNRDAADSLARLLVSWGYEPLVAYDGRACLELARSSRPQTALLDLGLPTMDGYQVALHIRQDPALKEMVLIAITGHDWKDAAQRSKEYGFNHHWVKPIDPDRLRSLLSGL